MMNLIWLVSRNFAGPDYQCHCTVGVFCGHVDYQSGNCCPLDFVAHDVRGAREVCVDGDGDGDGHLYFSLDHLCLLDVCGGWTRSFYPPWRHRCFRDGGDGDDGVDDGALVADFSSHTGRSLSQRLPSSDQSDIVSLDPPLSPLPPRLPAPAVLIHAPLKAQDVCFFSDVVADRYHRYRSQCRPFRYHWSACYFSQSLSTLHFP